MPRRKYIFANNHYYHVYNKTVFKYKIFDKTKLSNLALLALWYYQHQDVISLSRYRAYNAGNKKKYQKTIQNGVKLVKVLCYCLMPNHYHLLLEQLCTNGISRFMSNFQNSFTKYHNQLTKHSGPVFVPRFKAKTVETTDELLHLSRYIHLNPYTAHLTDSVEGLAKYGRSSFAHYWFGKKDEIVSGTDDILGQFKEKDMYQKYLTDRADYQRQLSYIKALTIEKTRGYPEVPRGYNPRGSRVWKRY